MGKRITDTDRIRIESLYNSGHKVPEIAKIIGKCERTLWYEIKRGKYEHRNTDYTTTYKYSSDKSKALYKEHCENCGRPLKIGNDYALVEYLTNKIKGEQYSPAAALASIERDGMQFKTTICVRTVYNYIYSGMVFLNVDRNDLPQKPTEIMKKRQKSFKKMSKGTSIEQRPAEILERNEFGHWEMDTVVSGKNGSGAVLVLTERKTLNELVWKIKTHEAVEPVKFLDKLEREIGSKAFRAIFKTITVDNGTENQDYIGLQRSYRNKTERTTIYYCHPYCACERGSNENQNKLIRRFIPKGSDISGYTRGEIRHIQDWMNCYPRKKFGWKTAQDLFKEECASEIGFVPSFFIAA